MRARRALAVVTWLVSAGCGNRPESELRPLAIAPSQGTAAAPLEVEITGQGFEPRVETDFQNPSRSLLDARFQAQLAPSGGAQVDLAEVTLTPRHTLTARIPAGLERGLYALTVTDPHGRSATLPDAFRVVTSAESVAGFRFDAIEPQYEGTSFTVTLTAIDAGGQTVDGFEGTVALTDITGSVTPNTLGPFTLGRFQGAVTVSQVRAGDQLTAADALGHTGTSDLFDVRTGPAVQLAFASVSVTVTAVACSPAIVLEARDALGSASPVQGPVAIELQGNASGLAFFTDGGCSSAVTTVTLAAGATQVSFHFRGGTPPALTLRALPDGLPSVEQIEVIQ